MAIDIGRRQFITALGSAVIVQPSAAQDRAPRVGVLVPIPITDPVFQRNMGAFTEAMKGAGWIEGRNLEIRVVSILGSGKSPHEAAAEVLAQSPDAIIAIERVAADALHQQTSTIPVVFVVGHYDPVERGFVATINKPGGNMTGITDLEPSLGAKWLELLKKIAPGVARAGIVYNPDSGTISALLWQERSGATHGDRARRHADPQRGRD